MALPTFRFFRTAAWGAPPPVRALWPVVLSLAACASLICASRASQAAATPKPEPVSVPHLAGDATPGVAQIQDLLDSLARFDQNGRAANQKLGFEVPERAVNEYLAFSLRRRPRPGIGAASVTLVSRNEVSLAFEVDFDSLGKWSAAALPDLLRPLMSGKQAMRVTAQFDARNGSATVTLKNAVTSDGNPLPQKITAELMQTLGLRQPESADPAKPIPLPFGLKRVWIDRRSVCGET